VAIPPRFRPNRAGRASAGGEVGRFPIINAKARMEHEGLTRKDLEPMIGSRTRVAEVLNRKRNLSIGMIRKLHAKLGISAEVLIQPTKKPRQPRKARRASA
jgi:transcriptional regulator with XRE-family HTH domain